MDNEINPLWILLTPLLMFFVLVIFYAGADSIKKVWRLATKNYKTWNQVSTTKSPNPTDASSITKKTLSPLPNDRKYTVLVTEVGSGDEIRMTLPAATAEKIINIMMQAKI